jgi:hypothetical protein
MDMFHPCDANGDPIVVAYWIKTFNHTFHVWHHGILIRVHRLGDSFDLRVVHNSKDRGVCISSLHDFTSGDNPFYIQRRPISPQHTEFILANAEANLGKAYNLFARNCEHFCHFCYTLEQKSESIEGLKGMLAVLGAVGLCAVIFSKGD